MITLNQIKKIHALARERGLDNETLHSFIYSVVKKEHIKELTKEEGIKVIDALDGKRILDGADMITNRQRMYIKGLAKEIGYTEESFRYFCKKVGGVDDIRFLKKDKASAVIEGLKKLKEKGIKK